MKELRLIELMGNIDEDLLIRANAPVPHFSKPRFRNAFIASAVAVLLAVTMITSPVAVVVSYSNAHPEIEGGLIYIMDAMINDEDHFISSMLPESAKNTLGSVFDALKGENDKSEEENESETEPEIEMPPASEGLKYELYDGLGYSVTGIGSCTDTVIVIPSTYNGLGVFRIEASAFQNCDMITEIYVGEGVKLIESAAFSQCSSLTDIHLPSTITAIYDHGGNPFQDCPLENIYLSGENEKLKLVNNSLLYRNSNNSWWLIAATSQSTPISKADLRAAGIDAYSYQISPQAFSNRRNIKDFIVEYTGTTEIFENCIDLETVTLQNVTMIRSKNFANCPSLHTVYIPDTVTIIEDLAFENCTSLREIRFEGTISQWQRIEKVRDWDLNTGDYTVYCADGAFGNLVGESSETEFAFELNGDGQGYTVTKLLGTNTDTIILPSSHQGLPVTAISGSAFYGITDIVSVIIPDNVVTIGSKAFMDCTALVSVTLPSQMSSIGAYAFSGCTSLQSIAIPNGITEIDNYCFNGCTSLQKVVLPSTLIRIKKYGFAQCKSLRDINIPSGITGIGSYAFSACLSLKQMELPGSIVSIGEYAFYSCSSMTSINLPQGVKIINKNTFNMCTSLTELPMNESVTKICANAFSHCHGLTEIHLPDSLKIIETRAFAQCNNLESVYFGSGLTDLQAYAFQDSKALQYITFNGTREQFIEARDMMWASGCYLEKTYTYLEDITDTDTTP